MQELLLLKRQGIGRVHLFDFPDILLVRGRLHEGRPKLAWKRRTSLWQVLVFPREGGSPLALKNLAKKHARNGPASKTKGRGTWQGGGDRLVCRDGGNAREPL